MSRKRKHTSELLSQVGGRIRTLRLQNGFSQEELAFRANIHATTLSDIESGKANLTLVTCESIASALNVPVSFLFPKEASKEEEELSRLIARIQKAYAESAMKDKARYFNIMECITDNFM